MPHMNTKRTVIHITAGEVQTVTMPVYAIDDIEHRTPLFTVEATFRSVVPGVEIHGLYAQYVDRRPSPPREERA